MATPLRRIHDAHFKTKVVLEALKRIKTLAQLSSEFGINAQLITDRKRQALAGMPILFESTTTKASRNSGELITTCFTKKEELATVPLSWFILIFLL